MPTSASSRWPGGTLIDRGDGAGLSSIGSGQMVFSGRLAPRGDCSQDEAFQKLILQSTLASWNAHLKNDPSAHQWLADGGLAGVLGATGVFEHKPAPASGGERR